LLSSSKTHLAAGNQESKCKGFNDLTIVAGRNPYRGCSKRAQSPIVGVPSTDSLDLIQILEERQFKSAVGTMLISADVVALYPSIRLE
jgi:hypothetical protein